MSYVLVRGVFERGPKGHQNRGCRFILLCLADHANEDGTSCFPRVSTIAEQCQFTERYVKAGLKKLEEDGWIRSVQNPQEKDGRRNGYVIAADRLIGEQSSPNRTNRSSGKVNSATPKGELCSEIGEKNSKPPHPHIGVLVKNRQRQASFPLVFDNFKTRIQEVWNERHPDQPKLPWEEAEEELLGQLLDENPNLVTPTFLHYLRELEKTEPGILAKTPRYWLGTLIEHVREPFKRYRRLA